MGRKAHRCVETRDGGLLLGIEALALVFQHDGGVGVVKMPHCRIETRQGGVVGSGEAEQKKHALYGAFFLFGRWRDMSVGLGTCQWGWGHVSGVGDMSVGVGDVLVREGMYWLGGDMLGGEHQSVKH